MIVSWPSIHLGTLFIDRCRRVWNGRPDFLDIALLYALINFVGTIAVLKFFRYRAIGDVMWTPDQKEEES